MNKVVNTFYEKFGISSQRTKNITKHVGISFFLKGGSIIITFLLVPLTINYLDTENYGVWLTLSSFVVWFSFFDIGLGNGLRNKFAEAKALGDNKLAQAYVSSAYYTIGVISILIVAFFFIINPNIDWTAVFNTSSSLKYDLKILMPIVFTFFSLQLVVNLITTIYTADQHHSIQGKINFIVQATSLLVIWILTKTGNSSLLVFGTIFSAIPVFILIFLNLLAFNNRYKDYKPRFHLWRREYLKEIMGIGLHFFVIQIAALVLFSTDNLIISKLFTPAEVVPYNIAYKYFSIVTMIYGIVITPYWSSFTEAYSRQDFEWIKNSITNIQRLWFLIPPGLIIMVLVSDWFYKFWVGDTVIVPISLSIAMAFFVFILTFNMIYVYFINGVGKIKIQLITSVVVMALNIPLSVLFAKIFNWGVSGVILATCVCLFSSVILFPIQYKKIINNRAEGIWNK